MGEDLKELISSADKGNTEAQRELMQRGDAASEAGDHHQAAYLYKMAAMAYRIDASRIGGILADMARQGALLSQTVSYYDQWAKKYTKPVAPRINRLKRHKGNFDVPILTMWREKNEYGRMLRYLENKLMRHGIEICAPGGTINRHFYYMVHQRERYREFMNDVEFRVVLDPICDEVLNMCEKI
ncbi:MAG: hypothetical protein AB7U43_05595 [Desulfobacter sp.]